MPPGDDKPKPPMTDLNQPLAIAGAIIAGAELGVYAALRDGPRTAAQLAAAIGADAEGVERLLDVLCVAEYVVREGERFAAGAKTRAWLTPGSETDFTPYLRWMTGWWDRMAAMPEIIRTGSNSHAMFERMEEKPERAANFAAFMRARAHLHVDEIAGCVELPEGCRTLIDLGGSHGLHAAALCRKYPDLRATIFDLPAALTSTPALIAATGVADRIELREGNYHADAVGSGWDAALLYDIIHNNTPAQTVALLAKIAGALNPGGTLVIHEVMRPDPPDSYNAMFSLTLWLNNRTRTHSFDEIRGWLDEAGFVRIVRKDLPPRGQSSVLLATVPGA